MKKKIIPTLKEIYRFCKENATKTFNINSRTDCVVCQLIHQNHGGVVWFLNHAELSYEKHGSEKDYMIPTTYANFTKDQCDNKYQQFLTGQEICDKLRKIMGKGENYFLS